MKGFLAHTQFVYNPGVAETLDMRDGGQTLGFLSTTTGVSPRLRFLSKSIARFCVRRTVTWTAASTSKYGFSECTRRLLDVQICLLMSCFGQMYPNSTHPHVCAHTLLGVMVGLTNQSKMDVHISAGIKLLCTLDKSQAAQPIVLLNSWWYSHYVITLLGDQMRVNV